MDSMNTTHVIAVSLGSVLAAGYGLGRVRPHSYGSQESY